MERGKTWRLLQRVTYRYNIATSNAALDRLLADVSVSEIFLGKDLVGNFDINRTVTINGQGHKITGTVTVVDPANTTVTFKNVTITDLQAGN